MITGVMETNPALVVDDCRDFRSEVRNCLSPMLELVDEAASVSEFEALYRRRQYDLVILDMRQDEGGDGRQGLELLRRIHALDERQPVIIVSSYGDADSILDAADASALTLLHKEEFSPPLLARMADLAIWQAGIQRQLGSLQTRMPHGQPYEMASVAESMSGEDRRIGLAAADGQSMVVIGRPLGCGHEIAASAIHRLAANRSAGPWVCASAEQSLPALTRVQSCGVLAAASPRERTAYSNRRKEARCSSTASRRCRLAGETVLARLRPNVRRAAGATARRLTACIWWPRPALPDSIPWRLGCARSLAPHARWRSSCRGWPNDRLTSQPWCRTTCARSKVRGTSPQALAVLGAYSWPGNLAELREVVEYAGLHASLAGRESIEPVDLPDRLMAARAASTETDNYEWHLVLAELSLVEAALAADRRLLRGQTARRLGYNDRFVLGRRMRKALAAFPALRLHVPEVKQHYGHGRSIS